MNALTLPDLIDTLVAARRAGGFRYHSQQRVLRQFAEHARREGHADGSIIKERAATVSSSSTEANRSSPVADAAPTASTEPCVRCFVTVVVKIPLCLDFYRLPYSPRCPDLPMSVRRVRGSAASPAWGSGALPGSRTGLVGPWVVRLAW